MASESVIDAAGHADRGTVVLPCTPDQFRDFIAGLLGRPQTIERFVAGPFEVSKAEIENLYHLIDQRILSQNEATLVQFTARVIYDDNSSVLLNSFPDFQAYNEVKPLQSIAVHTSWTWLIQFRNKKHPEKQQIDVSFACSPMTDLEESFYSSKRIALPSAPSGIQIRINHTDRTWGTDIEALLVGHLEMLRKPQTTLRAFAYTHSGRIGLGVSIIVLICALFAGYSVTNSFVDSYLSAAKSFASNDSVNFENVAKKIDFLLSVIASGMWTRYAVYVVVLFIASVVVAIILGVVVGSFAENQRPSFVLLTKSAAIHRDRAMRKYENNWLIFCASLLGSIGVSVVGNYAFYRIMQIWALP